MRCEAARKDRNSLPSSHQDQEVGRRRHHVAPASASPELPVIELQELGAADNDNGAWATATANLNAFAGQTVRIVVEAADASTASLVDAGIDDVVVKR